jgi:hypothetical protein
MLSHSVATGIAKVKDRLYFRHAHAARGTFRVPEHLLPREFLHARQRRSGMADGAGISYDRIEELVAVPQR